MHTDRKGLRPRRGLRSWIDEEEPAQGTEKEGPKRNSRELGRLGSQMKKSFQG